MYKKLRIICTIISAVFLAAILPITAHYQTLGLLLCGLGAGIFFCLMLACKKAQLNWEEKNGIPSDILNTSDNNPTEEDTPSTATAEDTDKTQNNDTKE